MRVRDAISLERVLLVGLLALAAVLRTRTITQSLWFDEIVTVRVSQAEFGSFYSELLTHNNMHLPLYCLITRLFLWSNGSDWLSRIPALLFSVAQVPLFWLLAKRVVNKQAAWVATFLLVISPIDVHYAQDARAYSLLGFGSLLGLYGLWTGLHGAGKGAWFLCFLGNALSIHAAYFGFFAVFAEGILLLVVLAGNALQPRASWREIFRPFLYFLACGACTAVAFVPCLPLVLYVIRGHAAIAAARQLPVSFSGEFFRGQIVNFGWGSGPALWLCYAALTAGLLYAIFARRPLVQLAASYAIGAYFPFFVLLWYCRIPNSFQYRYIIFVLPVFLLLVAQGLACLTKTLAWMAARVPRLQWMTREGMAFCLACALAAWCFWPSILGMFVELNENWRDTCHFVAAHAQPDDATVIQPPYADYALAYYGGNLPHVTPLNTDDVEGLSRLAAQPARIWYIGKWGAKTPKMAKKMEQLSFVPIYDAWAQGLILEVRDPSFRKEDRGAAELRWRTMAYNEVAWTPFMDVWLARAFRDAQDEQAAQEYFRKGCDGLRRALNTDAWDSSQGVRTEADRLALARLLDEMGERDRARGEYRRLLDDAPRNVTAAIELARLEDAAQNHAEAIRLYKLYVALDPGASPYILLNMAKLYEQLGDIDAAFDSLKSLYRRLNASEGAPPYYWTAAACVLASHGQMDRALSEFQAILRERPEYTYAYWRFAEALMRSGANEKAYGVVLAGLAYEPGDPNLLGLKEALDSASQSSAARQKSP